MRVILRRRTIAAALISGALTASTLLAACSNGDDGAGTPTPTPDGPATVASLPSGSGTGSPSASVPPPKAPGPGNVSLGDLDTKNFNYAGGCGFELPAPPIALVDGRQKHRTPTFDGHSSAATWSSSTEVTLDGRPYLVVQLRCAVGSTHYVGAHLIGLDGRKPADLGIIATGTRITISAKHDQLAVSTAYPTIKDDHGGPTGHSSYAITMAGLTPVRLYAGEHAAQIDPAIAKLPAHGYDAGLVGISGYADDPSDTSWVVGLLDRPGRVLTAELLGGGYDSGLCWKATIYTQGGEKLGHKHLAYNGNDGGTGTAIDLSAPSKATTGVRGTIDFPVTKATPGLLIPANGVVPALATATTETAANGQGDAVVTTKAPADAVLDIEHFGAASGSEYSLPVGAFATADGKIAMTGAWYNDPVDKSNAAFGMRPIVDPADLGEKTC